MIIKEKKYPKGHAIFFRGHDHFRRSIVKDLRFIISYLKNGNAIIKTNGETYSISAPSILLVGEKCQIEVNKSNKATFDSLYFHPSFTNTKLDFTHIRGNREGLTKTDRQDIFQLNIFNHPENEFKIVELNSFNNTQLKSFMDNLSTHIIDQPIVTWPCMSRLILMNMIFFIKGIEQNDSSAYKTVMPNSECDLLDVIKYLNSHYQDNITIESLADKFGTNRTTINTKFKVEYNITIKKYLNQIRIEQALLLLRNSDLTITEIALDVGYKDVSNFGRAVKQLMGCTPGQYRSAENIEDYTPKCSTPRVLNSK